MSTCYEILNAGDGGRGPSVDVESCRTDPKYHAEQAADYFDGREMRTNRPLTDSDLDGCSRVIEVVGLTPEPVRFRVWTRVVRIYEAVELGG